MALSVLPGVTFAAMLTMMEVLAARIIAITNVSLMAGTVTTTATMTGRHPVVRLFDVADHLAFGLQDVTGGQNDQEQEQTNLHGPFAFVTECFHFGLGFGFYRDIF